MIRGQQSPFPRPRGARHLGASGTGVVVRTVRPRMSSLTIVAVRSAIEHVRGEGRYVDRGSQVGWASKVDQAEPWERKHGA